MPLTDRASWDNHTTTNRTWPKAQSSGTWPKTCCDFVPNPDLCHMAGSNTPSPPHSPLAWSWDQVACLGWRHMTHLPWTWPPSDTHLPHCTVGSDMPLGINDLNAMCFSVSEKNPHPFTRENTTRKPVKTAKIYFQNLHLMTEEKPLGQVLSPRLPTLATSGSSFEEPNRPPASFVSTGASSLHTATCQSQRNLSLQT